MLLSSRPAYSVLDLAPIPQGGTAADAFRHAADQARHAEAWGYTRYWLAEHHGMPGIASAATAVVIGHVAAATSSIRVGAGGIMLPNHAPLVVAEQFGTLASLFPGRIDLGLGRAPGTDPVTSRALRRQLHTSADDFPEDVAELQGYFAGTSRGGVRAVPGAGLDVPIWILGSSLYGAQLAAAFGLPYAFASHFAPAQLDDALLVYRRNFRPVPGSPWQRPYVMLGFNIFAADSDEEAVLLASSAQQAFVNLRSGRPSQLPPPVPGYLDTLGPAERGLLDNVLSCAAIGAPATVRDRVAAFLARTHADELMITAQIHDHAARRRSYELAAGVLRELGARAADGAVAAGA